MSFRRWLPVLLPAAVLLAWMVPEAAAQGCSMCKLNVQAGGERTARYLDYGIFILLVPAVGVFLGLFYWAFSHRDRSLLSEEEEAEALSVPLDSRPGDARL